MLRTYLITTILLGTQRLVTQDAILHLTVLLQSASKE